MSLVKYINSLSNVKSTKDLINFEGDLNIRIYCDIINHSQQIINDISRFDHLDIEFVIPKIIITKDGPYKVGIDDYNSQIEFFTIYIK